MKKFTLIFTLVVMAVASFAAEYHHPGWWCEDNAAINTQYLIAKEAGHIHNQIDCLVLMKFNEGKIKSFTELKTVVAEVVTQVVSEAGDGQKDTIAGRTIYHIKRTARCRNQFITEAWNYCKANPTKDDVYYILKYDNNKICSDEERYTFLADYLMTVKVSNSASWIKHIKSCVEKVIDLGATANVTNQKTYLQKFNRRFSKNLLVNKAAWEPIIVCIRTALETY